MNSISLRSLYLVTILPLVGLIFYGLAIIISGDYRFIFGILGILCFIIPLFIICRLVFMIRKILQINNISILPDLILFDPGTDADLDDVQLEPPPDDPQNKKQNMH